jgi:hypothetical protein
MTGIPPEIGLSRLKRANPSRLVQTILFRCSRGPYKNEGGNAEVKGERSTVRGDLRSHGASVPVAENQETRHDAGAALQHDLEEA